MLRLRTKTMVVAQKRVPERAKRLPILMSPPGLSAIKTPPNPMKMAAQRCHSTRSLRIGIANRVAKMGTDIAKSIYRKMATEGIQMNEAFFRSLKAAYLRIALDFVEMYCHDAKINGLSFNRHGEEEAIEVFQHCIVEAGHNFSADPLEVPFINNWKRVLSAVPDFTRRLYTAVEEDNQ